MDRIRIEVIAAIELKFANCRLAKAAALSEINSFFEIPEFRAAVKNHLDMNNDYSAALTWAAKRAELWRGFENLSAALGEPQPPDVSNEE
jgi:hypothetical protein